MKNKQPLRSFTTTHQGGESFLRNGGENKKRYRGESINGINTKGKEYAKYGVERDIMGKNDPPPYNTGTDEQKKRRAQQYYFALMGGCFIYMEVGDISRKLNDQSEDFKF